MKPNAGIALTRDIQQKNATRMHATDAAPGMSTSHLLEDEEFWSLRLQNKCHALWEDFALH